jgi:hypothetical protein
VNVSVVRRALDMSSFFGFYPSQRKSGSPEHCSIKSVLVLPEESDRCGKLARG